MFRLQCIHLFLTYSKCPISKEQALIYFQQKGLRYKYIIVAHEHHQDGTDHLHMYVQLKRKCDIRNASLLDMQHQGICYHGEYESARSPPASKVYCKKDGDYIEDGEGDEVEMDIFDAFASMDEREFLKYCIKRRVPKGYYDEVIKVMGRCYEIEEEEIPNGIYFIN